MVATSGFRQFVILLYKGLLLRKRHYIVTFFELVIPVFVASILCIIKAEEDTSRNRDVMARDRGSLWDDYATYKPFDPFGDARYQLSRVEFVFTPNNTFTRKFVQDSAEFFRQRKRFDKHQIGIVPASSEKELETFCTQQQRDNPSTAYIGTVFQNFGDKLPSSLDYKIRYNSWFLTQFKTKLKYKMGTQSQLSSYMSDGI